MRFDCFKAKAIKQVMPQEIGMITGEECEQLLGNGGQLLLLVMLAAGGESHVAWLWRHAHALRACRR